jgi:cytochrome P450
MARTAILLSTLASVKLKITTRSIHMTTSSPHHLAEALVTDAPPSPAGPLEPGRINDLRDPPTVVQLPLLQTLNIHTRYFEFVLRARRDLGEVFQMRTTLPGVKPIVVITSHPAHARSLFTAEPEQAPPLASRQLKMVLGSDSVLTAVGPAHMSQRKRLLPCFRGEAVTAYSGTIHDLVEREIDSWPVGRPFRLAPRMRAITLDVIMAGVFGVRGKPRPGTVEHRLRLAIDRVVAGSSSPMVQMSKLLGAHREKNGHLVRIGIGLVERPIYAAIRQRRRDQDLYERQDILSRLLTARTEDGQALSDEQLRDEILGLLLAGHATTANSLAWVWERLVRSPDAHDALREAVRGGGDPGERVEATIIEGMRSRPVLPGVTRRVTVPWRLGPYAVPAGTPIDVSILLIHHREDLYPEPFRFRPERWIGRKPEGYGWIPFGGGVRRCLGASLAMIEQRVVVERMASRLDLDFDDPAPERPVQCNVVMVPSRDARVIVRARLP